MTTFTLLLFILSGNIATQEIHKGFLTKEACLQKAHEREWEIKFDNPAAEVSGTCMKRTK